jgi:hypothetical protein
VLASYRTFYYKKFPPYQEMKAAFRLLIMRSSQTTKCDETLYLRLTTIWFVFQSKTAARFYRDSLQHSAVNGVSGLSSSCRSRGCWREATAVQRASCVLVLFFRWIHLALRFRKNPNSLSIPSSVYRKDPYSVYRTESWCVMLSTLC